MAEEGIEGCSFCRETLNLPRLKSPSKDKLSWEQLILSGVKSTEKEIGRGAYGRVFEVEYENAQYAAKEVHELLLESAQNNQNELQKIKESFMKECHIWSQLEHPCIVQFLGVYYPAKDKLPVIVMEKMYNSLRSLVDRHTEIPFANVVSILNDVCCGLQYLHSRDPPIVHRDLTPNNILVCYHLRAKITDLGVAKVLQPTDTKTLTQIPGTPDFMPLESFFDNPVYGLPLDIFSFGGVILYVTTQQWPKPAFYVAIDRDTGGRMVPTELQRRQQYVDRMTGLYTNLKSLVISCLDDNPENRPSVAKVLLKIKDINLNFFSTIWSAEVSGKQHSTTRLQDQQDEVPNLQQQEQIQQEQTKLQEGEQATLQLQKGEQHEQLEQNGHSEFQKLNVEKLPQSKLNGREKHENISKNKKIVYEKSFSKKTKKLPVLPESNDDKLGGNTLIQKMPKDGSCYPLFVAKYEFVSSTYTELGFNKGELLYVINMDERDWWFAKAKHSGQEGFIPSNYVTEFDPLEAEDWFFKTISKVEAEKQLMQPYNDCGSFLISVSECDDYKLSIRDTEKVWHYRIRKLGDGVFFVTRQVTFKTLSDLVAHYRQKADGLCVTLKNACLIAETPQTVGISKEANGTWEIERKSIRLVKKIGTAQFSEVWMGIWKGATEVAVKILKSSTVKASKCLEEVAFMKKLRHPNLIRLYGICTKEEPIYIITEFMKHGSLLKYIRGDGQSLKHPQLINMAVQVAAGMAYLEEKKCIHRDLAARSILVGQNHICKVADFGLACVLDEDIYEPHTGAKFPIKWTAPEAAMYNRYTIKSDVWSFGILLYELITYGRLPYPGMNNVDVLKAVKNGYRMSCPIGCPQQLYEIMKECWNGNVSSRPTFESLQYKLKEFYVTESLSAPEYMTVAEFRSRAALKD